MTWGWMPPSWHNEEQYVWRHIQCTQSIQRLTLCMTMDWTHSAYTTTNSIHAERLNALSWHNDGQYAWRETECTQSIQRRTVCMTKDWRRADTTTNSMYDEILSALSRYNDEQCAWQETEGELIQRRTVWMTRYSMHSVDKRRTVYMTRNSVDTTTYSMHDERLGWYNDRQYAWQHDEAENENGSAGKAFCYPLVLAIVSCIP